MTDGDYSKTDGWNLQLQGKVRLLEAELAKVTGLLRDLVDALAFDPDLPSVKHVARIDAATDAAHAYLNPAGMTEETS